MTKIPHPVGSLVLTACQIRMARAALRISAAELARGCGVSERTVWRIEQSAGVPKNVTVDSLERIRVYLERQGITFIMEDYDPRSPGPGVRFGAYPGRAR